MKGIGPRPIAKNMTKNSTETADNSLTPKKMEEARAAEENPMPQMDSNKQLFRPSMSGSGAHSTVAITLTSDIAMVSKAELVGKRSERSDTEYIITLFMPVNC